ncbi:MAG: S8 family serine peptidase, partial [Nanoarchaeota archaeon]|nr:S8 family serine peptidase [Nanoarchaeota archaeon]
MRKIFFFIVIFLILTIGTFFVSSKQSQIKVSQDVYDSLDHVEKVRVIIKLQEPSQEKGFLIKTQKTDLEINLEKQEIKESVLNEIKKENVKHVFDDYIAIVVSKEKLNELENNLNIDSIIMDKPIYAFLQDSVPHINASSVWPIQISGINITGINETICILDTGINFSHPDLINKNKTCIVNCITENCVKNCSIGDDNGHGTHVAGIAAASLGINGVAIGANLIGVKVLGSNGEGVGSDLYAGIDWCITNAYAYNISVISMSLGDCSNHSTYCNGDLSAPHINNAAGNNISVIVSAGNCNSIQCPGISCTEGPAAPACVENATAVGAVSDVDDSIFYQRGALFELLAPGININSTKNTGGYEPKTGTSMSAPHVAGAIALLQQFYKLQNGISLTPQQIKDTLNNTGVLIDDSSGSGYNFSRIDVYSAILSLDGTSPNISLISPADSLISQNVNQTFSCNAS